MDMQTVTSSNLAAIGYDEESETMQVRFNSGTEWTYDGVPKDVFESVRDADSVGRAFITQVRDSYPGSRVS